MRQQAIQLDGHDDWLEVADSSSLHITGAITIEAWIRPDDANENGVLISRDFKYAGPSWCQMYFWGESRNLQVAVNDDAGPTVVSQTPIEPGKWHHVAMTYDGNQRTRIYVNGRLDREDTTRYHGPILAGAAPLQIGKRADGHPFRAQSTTFDYLPRNERRHRFSPTTKPPGRRNPQPAWLPRLWRPRKCKTPCARWKWLPTGVTAAT